MKADIKRETVRCDLATSAATGTFDDFYLRALAPYYPINRQRAFDTLKLLHQAIAIDQGYGPALSWTAIVLMRLYREAWAEDAEATRREAVETCSASSANHP